MKRFLPLLLLCIVIAAAFAIRAHDDRTAVVSEPSGKGQRAQNRSVSAVPPAGHHVAVIEAGSPAVNGPAQTPPSTLAERTTWTNPFAESFWTSANWQFNADSMTALTVSDAGPQSKCIAEFLRQWTTFTAALQVETPADDESLAQTHLTLELEVVHVTSGDALRVSLQPGRAGEPDHSAPRDIPDQRRTHWRAANVADAKSSARSVRQTPPVKRSPSVVPE